MKKVALNLFMLVMALVLMAMPILSVMPALADDGGKHKAGDKIPLPSGDEATFIGYRPDGTPLWQAVIGEPVYLPGTNIYYDCQWYLADGGYVAGDNTFDASVDGKKVTVVYEGKQSNWKPDVIVGTSVKKEKDVLPTVLPIDPINYNYYNNTLMWDYGDGVKRYLRIIEGMLIEYYILDYPVDGDIVIDNKVQKDVGFVYHRPAFVFDADRNPIEFTQTSNHKITISQNSLAGVVYPITIDPDSSFTTSASDGYLHEYVSSAVSDDVSWDTAHDAASSTNIYAVDSYLYVGVNSRYCITNYETLIQRPCVYFNTASLPDDANITVGVLELYGAGAPGTDFGAWTLQVQSGMATYPHDPLVKADYDATFYAGDGGTLASGLMGIGYKEITLNATGRGWINKTGYTKFALRELEHDINDTKSSYPVQCIFDRNSWSPYSYEKGEGFRPTLSVTYGAAAPAITADSASNVGQTSARLNATVTDDGTESCEVRWGYGTANVTAINFLNYDTITDWSAAEWDTGEHPYFDTAGEGVLLANTQYWYRVQIKNTHSTVTSLSRTFTTATGLAPPTNFKAYPAQDLIDLSWVKGEGSNETYIRYALDTFPTDNVTGIFLFQGTENAYEFDGTLIPGNTYYFTAWGLEAGGSFSDNVTMAAATTFGFGIDDDDLETPDMFSRWFDPPDYTRLVNIEPLYSAVNGVADSFGTPRNTVWTSLVLGIIAVISILLMTRAGWMAGMVVGIMLLVLGAGVHILPTWMVFTAVVFGIAGWALNRKGVST